MKQRTYWKSVKHFFPFKLEEWKGIMISVLILGFIFSFKEWGIEKFDMVMGIRNLIISIMMAFLALLAHQAGARLFGIKRGYRVEFKLWFYGLLIGLAAVFVSNGRLWFIAPGGIIIHHMAGYRIGFFRYGLNYLDLALICFFGILGNIALAFICKFFLAAFPASAFLTKLMMINIWMALWSMVPIPPLDGANILYASRLEYVFFLLLLIAVAIFMTRVNLLLTIILAVVFAFLGWLGYWLWASEKGYE